ncbi:MAG: hypothetical protein U9Q83_11210 [Bacteroidota bacterium]|nr:hypothetical protein [Bacteroidota bacterium]
MLFKAEISFKSLDCISDKELNNLVSANLELLYAFARLTSCQTELSFSYYHRDERDEIQNVDVPILHFSYSRNVKHQKSIVVFSSFLQNSCDLINLLELPIKAHWQMLE